VQVQVDELGHGPEVSLNQSQQRKDVEGCGIRGLFHTANLTDSDSCRSCRSSDSVSPSDEPARSVVAGHDQHRVEATKGMTSLTPACPAALTIDPPSYSHNRSDTAIAADSDLVFDAVVLVEQSPQFSSFCERLDRNPTLIIARAGCLGLRQQLAGMGDKFGDFEGLYQEGNTVFLQE